MEPQDYNFDVFLSYKRSTLIEPWVTNYFYKLFEGWLAEKLMALNMPPPKIFFDQLSIETGEKWPISLQNAIKTSKVLVAVCSPSYFYSHWCTSEWESFVKREQMLGINGLKIPIRHNDCEQFLSDIQYSDFFGYTFLAKDFYQSIQGAAFEQKVQDLAEKVARTIKSVPPFQSSWPSFPTLPTNPNIPMQRL